MTRSILVVAGEASGDLHGGEILRELKALRPDLRTGLVRLSEAISHNSEPVRRAWGVDVFEVTWHALVRG